MFFRKKLVPFGAPIEPNDRWGKIQGWIWGMRRQDYKLIELAIRSVIEHQRSIWNLYVLQRRGIGIACVPDTPGEKVYMRSRAVHIRLPLEDVSIHISWSTGKDAFGMGPDNISVCYWTDEYKSFAANLLMLTNYLVIREGSRVFSGYCSKPRTFLCEMEGNVQSSYSPVVEQINF